MTFLVKIGYNMFMSVSIISLILRILFVVVLWAYIWRLVEPRTQVMRILRAGLLLLCLLGTLALLRIAGR